MKLYKNGLDTTEQSSAFVGGEVPVAVYGLGKMGLPLAGVYADVTGNVIGADIDPDVVDAVTDGRAHFDGEPGLDSLIADVVEAGALEATTDTEVAASRASVHVIIIPTLVDSDKSTDLSILKTVVDDIATGLEAGDLVVLESTVPPRTATDVVEPRLAAESGLDSTEFGVAVCPERTATGSALSDIRRSYPKIVGGTDMKSTETAEAIYGTITSHQVVPVSNATVAEAVKVFEGVYRDVNIALANELARYARELEVPVVEAIEAANTQPFCDIHDPGAGVGGHCIPYYPYFLINEFDASGKLLKIARSVNDEMPAYLATRLLEELQDAGTDPEDADVLVLGVTYRPGVPEIRESPALPLTESLATVTDSVTVVDPMADSFMPFREAGATVESLEAITSNGSFDAVVLVTDHEEFDRVTVPALSASDEDLLVVDGRQALRDLESHPEVEYRGVGVNL